VQEALAAGLSHIDAAHLYTGGESGATLGAASRRSAIVGGAVLIAAGPRLTQQCSRSSAW
jgi:aryl-alcohol dehydrogenase-like predicted oxidoreductase